MVDCCVLAAGMPNGMIAHREVPTLPGSSVYRLNEKAWFNKQIMLDWVEHVLAPYVPTAPSMDFFPGSVIKTRSACTNKILQYI